jgi:hypothetical protein
MCPEVGLIELLERRTGVTGRVICVRLTFASEQQRAEAREKLSLYAIGGHRVLARDWVERGQPDAHSDLDWLEPDDRPETDAGMRHDRRHALPPVVVYDAERAPAGRRPRTGDTRTEPSPSPRQDGSWSHRGNRKSAPVRTRKP